MAAGETQLERLNTTAENLVARVERIEALCEPANGELSLAEGYQLLVDELAAVKAAVVELQGLALKRREDGALTLHELRH